MLSGRLIAPRTFELVERDVPAPGDGEVLVRMEVIGICGSDTHRGYRDARHAHGEGATYPLADGFPAHENVGIVELGPDDLMGKRVLLHPKGLLGLSEYVVVPATRLVVVPSTGDPAAWLMVEPPATVLHSVKQMPPVVAKRVLIVGQGTMGLCWTHFMNRLGAAEIVVVDPVEHRLEWASSLGATTTINGMLTAEGIVDRDGNVQSADGNYDVVVEAAGDHRSVAGVFQFVKRAGLAVLFGTPPDEHLAVAFRVMRDREIRTLCTAPGQGDLVGTVMQEMLDLVQRKWMDPAQFVTHRFPFTEVEKAFALYDSHEDGAIKVVLDVGQVMHDPSLKMPTSNSQG